MQANEGVNTDLRQKPGEHRRHRSGGRGIGVGQPRREGEHCGFNAESHQQHQLDGERHRRVNLAQPGRQLRHIHRAGGRVGEGNADEENHRRHQRHHHVNRARTGAPTGPTQGDQHERRRQQDLKTHVEVEQVPGEEGVRNPRDQNQIRRVVDRHRHIRVIVSQVLRQRIHQHRERHDLRHHQHQGGQAVRHQGDPNGRGPGPGVEYHRPVVGFDGQDNSHAEDGQHR